MTSDNEFRVFYRQHFRAVVGLVISLTGDRNAAEDIAQEAFTRAYRRWDTLAAYDNPGAWVRRVAANEGISRWRRQGSERSALARLAGRPQLEVHLPETDDHFWRAVRSLPDAQAIAVALHYVEDLSIAQIAVVLDCPEGTVKSHLSRARQTLSATLVATEEVAR